MKKTMHSLVAGTLAMLCSLMMAYAQDTITVQLDAKSKVIIYAQDRQALSQLKQVDLNQIISQVLQGIAIDSGENVVEKTYEFTFESAKTSVESTAAAKKDNAAVAKSIEVKIPGHVVTRVYSDDTVYITKATWSNLFGSKMVETQKVLASEYRYKKLSNFWYASVGLNNYLEGGSFPDASGAPYGLMAGRSVFFSLGSYQRLRLLPKGNLSLYTGLELDRMTFRFQGDNFLSQNEDGAIFLNYREEFGQSLRRSRLGIWYLNVPLMMQFQTGKNANKLLVGFGGYAGLRLGSNTFIRENDTRNRTRAQDNFSLTSLRYGLEGQIGFDESVFFMRYDLNGMFTQGRGPDLNILTMGVRFEL
jgi:hypothetical protein